LTAHAPVRVELGDRSYDVFTGPGSIAGLLERIVAAGPRRIVVVADQRVAEPHAEPIVEALGSAGPEVDLHRIPAGETAKGFPTVERLCRNVLARGLERSDVLLGVGGGATTDLAGFVASILLRGVRFASVPTTLLGQVDAAIGGKTGIDVPEGKNLVGAFHQPLAVACDPAPLATLPPREFRAGLAEVVKTAWIRDPALFETLEVDPPLEASHPGLPEVVRRCVAVKADVVSRDEREEGLRACLNFGHTLGHAIETESRGRLLHGEAISLGLVAAVWLSVETGRCDAPLLERLVRLLERLGLPVRDEALDPDAVVARTRRDKKRAGGRDRYQLTRGLGLVSVAADLPEGAPRAAVEFLRR
jgi:3-dehydroquinate synthase